MSERPPIRIVVADDHMLFREGVVMAIGRESDLLVVGQAATGSEAIAQFREHRPDIVLLDLNMPQMGGAEAVMRIRQIDPKARVIILTTYNLEADIDACLRAGAMGYLLKEVRPEELIQSIRDVHAGRRRMAADVAERLAERMVRPVLTRAEVRVLQLMADGRSNAEIGGALGIAEGTVKAHTTRIFDKLGAARRTEAVAKAVEQGLIRHGSGRTAN